jgi:hypothetical protein
MPVLPAPVTLSAAGMALHTIREFGNAGLFDPASGFIPFVSLQLLLYITHALFRPARRVAAIALFATAILQLLGGAILSVLPLPFLPFTPDQSLHHYLSHALYGALQLPLLVTSRRAAANRPAPRSRTPDTPAAHQSGAVAPSVPQP